MADIITLKGKKALLLAEACKLSKEQKKIKARLEKIKKKLDLEKGSYMNKANDSVNVSETAKMSPIDPKKVFMYMKKNKLRAEYWKCVKVALKELRLQVPEKVVDKWERKISTTKRWTFK